MQTEHANKQLKNQPGKIRLVQIANQGQMCNRPEPFPGLIKSALLPHGWQWRYWLQGREGTRGRSSKNFTFWETFCMLHKQPPLPNESEFPNGIILGPPCGSLSGPLLKGRPQGGVSCAQFQRCWRGSPPALPCILYQNFLSRAVFVFTPFCSHG